MSPERIVAEARGWIGTPYRHGASARGLGCDCLGLVRGVLAGLGSPVPAPTYAPDWAEASGAERLLDELGARLARVGEPGLGVLLVFRWRQGRPASHLGIGTGEGRMVHAQVRAGVVEVCVAPPWRRRLAGCFSLVGMR